MGSLDNSTMKGVEQDDLVMPVINFSHFLHGTPSQKLNTAQQITNAFQTSGFFYLANHGIPETEVTSAFKHSAQFFSRPQSQKDELAWTTPSANRGYVASGREKVTQLTDPSQIAALRSSNPDLKESMEIGREDVPGHPNQWPTRFQNDQSGQEFTSFMKSFFLTLKNLHVNVMRAIAVGMLGGLDNESFFDSYTSNGDNNLRLLHYPPVRKSIFIKNPHQVRAGEHSDYGSITLLFQDSVGGLEVKSPKGTWVRATPIPGTIVVNAGDLLMRWSNDVIVSTKHRVIQPPPKDIGGGKDGGIEEVDEDEMCPARYSIAYFCNPNFDKWIEVLPGTVGQEEEKKYEGIYSGEYLVSRLAATY